jgi:hypothetical protein
MDRCILWFSRTKGTASPSLFNLILITLIMYLFSVLLFACLACLCACLCLCLCFCTLASITTLARMLAYKLSTSGSTLLDRSRRPSALPLPPSPPRNQKKATATDNARKTNIHSLVRASRLLHSHPFHLPCLPPSLPRPHNAPSTLSASSVWCSGAWWLEAGVVEEGRRLDAGVVVVMWWHGGVSSVLVRRGRLDVEMVVVV